MLFPETILGEFIGQRIKLQSQNKQGVKLQFHQNDFSVLPFDNRFNADSENHIEFISQRIKLQSQNTQRVILQMHYNRLPCMLFDSKFRSTSVIKGPNYNSK